MSKKRKRNFSVLEIPESIAVLATALAARTNTALADALLATLTCYVLIADWKNRRQ